MIESHDPGPERHKAPRDSLFAGLADTLQTYGRRVETTNPEDGIVYRLTNLPILDKYNIEEITFTPSYVLEEDPTEDGVFIVFKTEWYKNQGLCKEIILYCDEYGRTTSGRLLGVIGPSPQQLSPSQTSEVVRKLLSGESESDDPAAQRRLEQMIMDIHMAREEITPEDAMMLQELSEDMKQFFEEDQSLA